MVNQHVSSGDLLRCRYDDPTALNLACGVVLRGIVLTHGILRNRKHTKHSEEAKELNRQ
jgi:hypothetical protein